MSNNVINFHNLTKSQQNTVVAFVISAASMLFMGFLVVFIILAGKPGAKAAAPACTFSPTSVLIGGSLTVVSGGASGNVNLQSNTNTQLAMVIGNLPKNGSLTANLPVVPRGSYTISVGNAKLGSNGNVSCGTLTVTDQINWVLSLPVVSGSTVAFSFTPASNGNISLIIKNNNTVSNGTVVYDSGPIASGQTKVFWGNATAGSYSAGLYFGTTAVSNTVSFTVQPPVPTVSVTAASTNIPYNTSTNLTWTSTNATSCNITGGWLNAASVPTSGSISTGNLTTTTTYTLTCTGLGGSAKSSVTVTVQAPPSPATNLNTNKSCNGTGSGNIVAVNFTWTPSSPAGSSQSQYLDYSVYNNNFTGGTYQNINVTGLSSYNFSTGFAQGITYYWRVNNLINGNWYSSMTANFVTPTCPTPTPTPVPTSGQWTLGLASVSGSTVAFSFTPASNGNISLIIKNNNTVSNGTVVYDSGPIASGWVQFSWNNVTAGSYSAALYAFGTAAVSNTVNFNVQ